MNKFEKFQEDNCQIYDGQQSPNNQFKSNVESQIENESQSQSTNIEDEESQQIDFQNLDLDQEYAKDDTAYRRHFGKVIVFKIDKETNIPKYTIGPHWLLFLAAWSFIIGCSYYMVKKTIQKGAWYTVIITLIINIAEIISYFRVAVINPGIKSSQYRFINQEKFMNYKQYCHPCQIIRESGTYHCYDCDICIEGYDHHCPWVGKCIGKSNLKQFFIFLANTALFMAYNLLLALHYAHMQNKDQK